VYRNRILFILILLVTIGLSIGSHHLFNSGNGKAQLFDNLGNYHHPISTQVPLAQRYFDQGLTLAYGFNHSEAERSFREAARLDPNCAICYWGVALVLGPNINAPMKVHAIPKAWGALQKAIALSDKANNQERAYIQALAKRYSIFPFPKRSKLDVAYANAMRELVKRYPDDLDAATLFAEAVMDTTPWKYWDDSGNPMPEGKEMMATLESVLERNPNHPGANHFYIHAVEAERPELGLPAANRLAHLIPGLGHLLHMPSHIYIQVGRYHDAVIANQRAIAADQDYVTQSEPTEFYRMAYMAHNTQFLWAAAMLAGERQVAIDAAYQTAGMIDHKSRQKSEKVQRYSSLPLYTFVQFQMWDKILAQPAPKSKQLYATGVWHYARGMAMTAKGQLAKAARELESLQAIAATKVSRKTPFWENGQKIINIASQVLAGKLEAQQGNYEQAVAHLETAVELKGNPRGEPTPWYFPVRQSLGAVLLETGRLAEAEQVYREELKIYPNKGWSLSGLAKTLQAQGKTEEAKAIQKRLESAQLLQT
jgi:tetratricopeptide (TPR) repeat protein